VFLAELLLVAGAWVIGPSVSQSVVAPIPTTITNTEALGRVLYTQYVYYFEAAGLVLLVAMIGAIVLTLRSRPGVRRQRVSEQLYRPKDQTITVVKVPTRGGV